MRERNLISAQWWRKFKASLMGRPNQTGGTNCKPKRESLMSARPNHNEIHFPLATVVRAKPDYEN